MSYKKTNGLNQAYMKAAHSLKSKADLMPDCQAKDFYLSLFNHYVKYGRWSDKQLTSVGKALKRTIE